MYYPVVSNEYEIASHILKSLFKKGLISKEEFDKIDTKNKMDFIADISAT